MSLAPSIAHDDALERLLGDVAVSIRSQHRVRPTVDQAIAVGRDGLSLVYVLEGDVRLPPAPGCPNT